MPLAVAVAVPNFAISCSFLVSHFVALHSSIFLFSSPFNVYSVLSAIVYFTICFTVGVFFFHCTKEWLCILVGFVMTRTKWKHCILLAKSVRIFSGHSFHSVQPNETPLITTSDEMKSFLFDWNGRKKKNFSLKWMGKESFRSFSSEWNAKIACNNSITVIFTQTPHSQLECVAQTLHVFRVRSLACIFQDSTFVNQSCPSPVGPHLKCLQIIFSIHDASEHSLQIVRWHCNHRWIK